jgi:hypothetical protein
MPLDLEEKVGTERRGDLHPNAAFADPFQQGLGDGDILLLTHRCLQIPRLRRGPG